MRLPKIPQLAVPRVKDKFPSEIKMQDRRTTGITPHLLGSYPEQPARMVPRSKEFNLRGLAGRK